MKPDKHDKLAAEVSRTVNKHAPATRRPEDVLAEMADQVAQSGRTAGNFPPAYVTLTDHGPDREAEARLSHSFQQLTPPPGVE